MLHYKHDPNAFAINVLGFHPDPHQRRVLSLGHPKIALCCPRGWGKTEITAIRAAWQVWAQPETTTLVVSETAEKAAELVRRTMRHLEKTGLRLSPDPLRRHGFLAENGSRILPVPTRPGAIRGHRGHLSLVDEAALVSDETFAAVSGARSGLPGQPAIIIMSTPGAPKGFHFRTMTGSDPNWERIWVSASECSRYTPAQLEELRRDLGEDDFDRDYNAKYVLNPRGFFDLLRFRASITPLVMVLDTATRFVPALQPIGADRVLVGDNQWVPRQGFYVTVDLGQSRDYSTIVVLEYRIETLRTCDPMTRLPHCEIKLRLRWMQRLPLGTGYDDIIDIVTDLVRHTELWGKCQTLVDAGGVGRAFIDSLKRQKIGPVKGIQLTGGVSIRQQGDMVNIPKNDVIHTFDRVLRRDMLQIAADVPFLKELEEELVGFSRIRHPSGAWGFSGKANGTDDLLMALAMGVGYACLVHKPRSLER